MKKLIALILAVLMLSCSFAAVADSDNSLQAILDKGTLILGLDDTFAPMGFRDENGEIVGFDIDLATAVCEKLGVELVLQPVVWENKEAELATGNIDCIWNGLSITEERLASMAMTTAYMNNAMALVSYQEDSVTVESMAGRVLGIQAGSYAEEMIYSEEFADLYDLVADVVPFEEYATAFIDLTNGNLDAILVDSVYAGYVTANLEGTYYIGEGLEDDMYGVAFRQNDIALRDAVEEAINELAAEGVLTDLSMKWLGQDLTCR